jgi:hypothetical protein
MNMNSDLQKAYGKPSRSVSSQARAVIRPRPAMDYSDHASQKLNRYVEVLYFSQILKEFTGNGNIYTWILILLIFIHKKIT